MRLLLLLVTITFSPLSTTGVLVNGWVISPPASTALTSSPITRSVETIEAEDEVPPISVPTFPFVFRYRHHDQEAHDKNVALATHAKTTITPTTPTSRRDWLVQSVVGSAAMVTAAWGGIASATTTGAGDEKESLLRAIERKAGDEEILECIDRLLTVEPATVTANHPLAATVDASTSATSSQRLLDKIDGPWKLIWSRGAQQFSPLLQLPPPLTPESFQLVGSAAAPIVGSGRIAQVLTSGILGPTQVYLSSGIVEYATTGGKDGDHVGDSSSILQIRPPFRFQLGLSSSQPPLLFTLIDSESDADFRALNARTINAQLAPPNLYQQLYVDDQIRISKIIQGDPVIVGATFVHIKSGTKS